MSKPLVLDLPSVKPYADHVSFVEVPDFSADGAFDEAVQGVDYIQHIASPIPDGASSDQISDAFAEFVLPAVNGNSAILRAAAKAPTVKRIVSTSSTEVLDPENGAKTIGPNDLPDPVPLEEVRVTKNPHLRIDSAVTKFLTEHKPHFNVVSVFPSFVQGHNEPVVSADELRTRPSSNYVMIDHVMGGQSEGPCPVDLVLLDDVALTHVAAMESPKVNSGDRFIAAYTRPVMWEEIDPIVRRLFPDEVKSGLLSLEGKHPGSLRSPGGFENEKTTEALGNYFRGPEEMVQSLIGQLVELMKQQKQRLKLQRRYSTLVAGEPSMCLVLQ